MYQKNADKLYMKNTYLVHMSYIGKLGTLFVMHH